MTPTLRASLESIARSDKPERHIAQHLVNNIDQRKVRGDCPHLMRIMADNVKRFVAHREAKGA